MTFFRFPSRYFGVEGGWPVHDEDMSNVPDRCRACKMESLPCGIVFVLLAFRYYRKASRVTGGTL